MPRSRSHASNGPSTAPREARSRRMFAGTDFIDTAITETRAKHVSPAELRPQLERLKANWSVIRAHLRAQLLPSSEMHRRLQLVGAPTEPEQIGISRERLRRSYEQAYFIRQRFTVLDFAERWGLTGAALDHIFGVHGPWPLPAAAARVPAEPRP